MVENLGFRRNIATAIATALFSLNQSDNKRVHIKKLCPAPSTLGDMTNWMQYCNQMGIRCHRSPPTNCHSVHVSLQVRAFGEFMDAMEGEIDSRCIRLALELMVDVSPILFLESVFQEKVLKHFQKLFQISGSGSYMHGFIKSWGAENRQSDITVYVDDLVLANVEIKGELCYSNQEPNMQTIGYFVKFQQSRECEHAPI